MMIFEIYNRPAKQICAAYNSFYSNILWRTESGELKLHIHAMSRGEEFYHYSDSLYFKHTHESDRFVLKK